MDPALSTLPLKGLRVLELANILAGPMVGTFFAERGAKVTKVENPNTGGDITRSWKPEGEQTPEGISAYYLSVNTQKEVVFLDLKKEADHLHSLLKQTDVLILNMSETLRDKLGLHPDQLKKEYPQLIAGQIRGYHNKQKAAFDMVLQAETGLLSITGTDAQNLAKIPVAWIDLLAAHQLFEGLLMGLIQKGMNGTGSFWEVSLEETALASLINQGANSMYGAHQPLPTGTLHPNIAPYGEVFTTADGNRMVAAIGTDQQFGGLWNLLELPPELIKNYTTNTQRLANRTTLFGLIQEKMQTLSAEKWETLFEKSGIPFGRINTIAEALQSEEAQGLLEVVSSDNHEFHRMRCSIAKKRN